MALAQSGQCCFGASAINIVISVSETRDVINHGAPPPQPVIRYLRAKLHLNRQSQPNNASSKDARPCFYGDDLCCRDHDYNI